MYLQCACVSPAVPQYLCTHWLCLAPLRSGVEKLRKAVAPIALAEIGQHAPLPFFR